MRRLSLTSMKQFLTSKLHWMKQKTSKQVILERRLWVNFSNSPTRRGFRKLLLRILRTERCSFDLSSILERFVKLRTMTMNPWNSISKASDYAQPTKRLSSKWANWCASESSIKRLSSSMNKLSKWVSLKTTHIFWRVWPIFIFWLGELRPLWPL